MKKIIVVFAFVFIAAGSAYSQGDLKLGFNAGLPTGDSSDISSLQGGLDVAYLFDVAGFVEIGPLAGYSRFIGDSGYDDFNYIPVAASGRLSLPMFFVGLDLGYALATDDNMDGGVYYRPKVGFGIAMVNLIASYSGISTDGANISSVNLGIELSL
ncbi:hypothetical protein GCM10007103_13250 [Salinimicrobium marinum]|uniref:Outer membrane protein beta-barrel domain-containing protein n=1 Tax=Salinimicrobium marinum TaxID=680283 RepID=A0A918SDB6_9FLAO|nr:hypothetical protein [Salinimicrobium marinum]GHA33130.1 hypothetical protein GCM10007103_13250 [Salinimicrobium marinum]